MNMNERGFFTIVGLCLLVIAAISIKGVHEFETNYSNGIKNFKIEHKLQNLAESCLTEEIENVSTLNLGEIYSNSRNFGNYDEDLKNCSVQIRAKNVYLKKYVRTYSLGNTPNDKAVAGSPKNVIFIACVASCDSPFIVGKMYRCALAYILEDDPATENFDESATVHYLNSL